MGLQPNTCNANHDWGQNLKDTSNISSHMINVLDFKLTRLDALVELQVCGTLVLNSTLLTVCLVCRLIHTESAVEFVELSTGERIGTLDRGNTTRSVSAPANGAGRTA